MDVKVWGQHHFMPLNVVKPLDLKPAVCRELSVFWQSKDCEKINGVKKYIVPDKTFERFPAVKINFD